VLSAAAPYLLLTISLQYQLSLHAFLDDCT